ncbi:triose-phosphate isomerase [Persicimonas caeni]|uniref:Triosephosphate isomerase n=1 Tax=Persicimonas caeni TaxID=2292766 RepID=A0A4Y6PU15_PERCE|nr:triose-phosphate isomerase [Persicimonas caeni]QDG51733.1 triose-phosphate isomerase [Persicimonas caeni]QED32954.1 triose-phosphate isomerase [Persicimonas caeni]
MRKPIVAGNWKMNKHIGEAQELAAGVAEGTNGFDDVEVVVGPTAICLAPVAAVIEGSNLGLAAQNMHWADSGAYTGEVSPTMIKDAGCDWVILGHSERREYFHESDKDINHKTHVAIEHDLKPIVCIGETLEEREDERTLQKVEFQVRAALAGVNKSDIKNIVIAYEPIWAIGTGKTASPEQAQEVHADIRSMIADIYGQEAADAIRILYGGSVKPHNIAEIIAQPDVDGALVGGASLEVDSFVSIAETVNSKQ